MDFPRYGDWSPTQFDSNIDIDRQDWLVMPVTQTRDSGPLDQSNFTTFLDALGGESETVEVHRFGHWGPGWFEIIIIDPSDSKAFDAAYGCARALADYPGRAARCHDAAADGCDGSYTHEVIDDFREFGHDLLNKAWNAIDGELTGWDSPDLTESDYRDMYTWAESEFEECSKAFEADCDRIEQWHIENGTYEQQCG